MATTYLAECFWPGVTPAEVMALDDRASLSAGRASRCGQEIRYLGSMLVPEDEVVFCFFAGPTPDTVASVAREAQIPFARIVASTDLPGRPAGPTDLVLE